MDVKANPVKTEAVGEQQEIPKEKAAVHSIRSRQKETVACQVTTEVRLESKEPTSLEVESGAEHQDVPKEHAAVNSSGIMKKWHRGRHLPAGRHEKPKELTRGDCGSQGKLAAACRKVSHCAAVA
jgi:hypothetical protein